MHDQRSIAFGWAGLGCIAASLVLHLATPVLVGFALAFVLIAAAALALWPDRPIPTFIGLWVLAVAFMAAFWSGVDDSWADGFWFTMYISVLLGTLAFAVWVASGLAIWGVRRHVRRAHE